MSYPTAAGVALLSTISLCACNGSLGDESPGAATGPGASGVTGSSAGSASSGPGAGTGGAPSDGGIGGEGTDADAGPVDPCGSALFCEKFDDYAGVVAIADKQEFGPWRAALKPGAVMDLDGSHTVSGSSALHVHIDTAATAGGRLFADGTRPIFAAAPTHLYGRMMMYIDPNGTSIHWTFFGVSGDAEPSSPAAGRNASYIMSSLPKNGVNTYSFVYGLEQSGSDPYHDCSSRSRTQMPTAAWSCVSFEMDSVARKLRMGKDGAVDPILSVDDHGNGCVGTVPKESPWYGPAITQLFVGGWSFHPMDAPLDVWIDDLVVDTQPVDCPAQ